MKPDFPIRNIREADYKYIIGRINDWWGGREMLLMLPRLFFKYFNDTSYVYEDGEKIVGFLIGFISKDQAYIHFAGIDPSYRKKGIGSQLYEHFFSTVRELGCRKITCVTAPINKESILFHESKGFKIQTSPEIRDGVNVFKDYDGPGEDRVVFYKDL